jgi:hypothetical protein
LNAALPGVSFRIPELLDPAFLKTFGERLATSVAAMTIISASLPASRGFKSMS